MAEREKVEWDDVNLLQEDVTEEDIKDAEAMGRAIPGRYLCECESSSAVRKKASGNDGGYNYIAANLKWKIHKAYEVRGKAIPEEEQSDMAGGFIWDEVRMEHAREKEGMKKRRILIAKRVGLIDDTSEAITKEMWSTGIIGKFAVLTVEDREYEDAYGDKKILRGAVAFSGYDYPPKETSFDDI